MWLVIAGVVAAVGAGLAWRRSHQNSGAAAAPGTHRPDHRGHGGALGHGDLHQGNIGGF